MAPAYACVGRHTIFNLILQSDGAELCALLVVVKSLLEVIAAN